MKKMLNISNHVMGVNQLDDIHNLGYDLVELPENLKKAWGQLEPSNYPQICNSIMDWAQDNQIDSFHLAGFAPAVTLICMDVNPDFPVYYAYTARVSVDIPQPDGSVKKESKFTHGGFFRYVTDKSHLQAFE